MTILLRFYLMNQTLAALDKNEEVIYDSLLTTLMLFSMTSSTSLNTPSNVNVRHALYKKIYSGHPYIWDPRVVLSHIGLLISLQRLWILELVRLQNNVLNPPTPPTHESKMNLSAISAENYTHRAQTNNAAKLGNSIPTLHADIYTFYFGEYIVGRETTGDTMNVLLTLIWRRL